MAWENCFRHPIFIFRASVFAIFIGGIKISLVYSAWIIFIRPLIYKLQQFDTKRTRFIWLSIVFPNYHIAIIESRNK